MYALHASIMYALSCSLESGEKAKKGRLSGERAEGESEEHQVGEEQMI